MKNCTNCNAPIDDNATYCTQCGAKQGQQASNPQASNLYSNDLERCKRFTNNRTLAIVSLIVGIAFACFFVANPCGHIMERQMFEFDLYCDEGVVALWLEILCYLAAAVLSVVAGGYLYSYFSKRQ